MNDLISRSALFKSWDGLSDEIKNPDLLTDEMIKRTQEAPAVDAEPVRHGRWEYVPVGRFQCMECKHYIDVGDDKNYCPNCGAKMDIGATDEQS